MHLSKQLVKLYKKSWLKNKILGKKNLSGRNNSGKITIFHRGSGIKKRKRIIRYNRKSESTEIVCTIEHDPNRNALIASLFNFYTKEFNYILAPKYLFIGNIVNTGFKIEPTIGSSLPILNISIGTPIFNVCLTLFGPAKISRSAGTFCILKEKTEKYCTLEFPSGKKKRVFSKCFASVGTVSKELSLYKKLKKAGESRWLNNRPSVRGVAMNSVDHPNGGGEGKKSGKCFSPWGKLNKNK